MTTDTPEAVSTGGFPSPSPFAFRLAAGAWAVLVFVAHSIPKRQLARVPGEPWLAQTSWADKLVHVALFGILAGLAARGFLGRWVIVAAAALAFGVAMEVYQHVAVSGRSGSLHDLAADAAGLALGVGVAAWSSRRVGVGARPQ